MDADTFLHFRARRDEQIVAVAALVAFAFFSLGCASGYLAAPWPLDPPAAAPRCALHLER